MTRMKYVCAFAAAAMMTSPAIAQNSGTSASSTAANGYAGSTVSGELTMDQLHAMPREVAPFAVPLKAQQAKFFAGKKRVYIPSYALMITRSGEASAYSGGGFGSNASRRATIQTSLSGVSDALGAQLAGEAYADLIAQLKAAGYEIVTTPPAGVPATIGASTVKNGQTVYGPTTAPLVPGLPWVSANGAAFNSVVGRGNANGDDLIVLLPGMGIDYERTQSSGSRTFGTRADVGTRLRFHVMGYSGANVALHSPAPYNAAWNANFYVDQGAGTDEPFAVLAQTGDKSGSKALHTGLALMGLGNTYKSKKIYEATADPERFAALTRAGFRGLNASIVDQMKLAAAK